MEAFQVPYLIVFKNVMGLGLEIAGAEYKWDLTLPGFL